MFDADRPIIGINQDRLGRGVFAKYLARCMLDHQSPESLVVGLNGGWGSGKTSLINLVIEELRFAASNMLDEEKPIILNFSPWSYSGQGQLIFGFFRRLSSELRQCPFLENSAEIIQLLELYVSFFTQQRVPKILQTQTKQKLLEKFKKTNGEKEELYAWESGRDPIQVKKELNDLLSFQKHKIIIFIDNISRIEATEVNQILQIVKSMGDYANTIYLLSYDKEQIVKAINQTHGGEGNEYISKLVQLPFEVPPISSQDLEFLLLDRLEPIVKEAPNDSWSQSHWADVYYSTLKYFFNSVRDITRYVNTLSFSYPRVKDVVNPVDFFALTALETFAPQVLYGIRENKDLFTDLLDNVYIETEEQREKDKIRCDEILAREPDSYRPLLLKLILHLFPRIRSIYFPDEKFYHSETLAREKRRICSPDMFEVYFRLSIPTGYMSESELDMILGQANHTELFDQMLSRLNQDNRILRFLNLLDTTATSRIPEKNIGNIINALIDNGDLFPEGEFNLLSFNTPMRIHRICHQLLSSIPNDETRFEILKTAINNATKSLYIIVHELNVQGKQHIESEDTFVPMEYRDFTPFELQELRAIAVEKIEFWERIERLIEHPKLLPILYAWRAWSGNDNCKTFLQKIIQNDKGLLAFLCAALQIPIERAIAKQEKEESWKQYLENISNFIDISEVEPRAKAVFEGDEFEKLREREQLAILIFLDLIEAQTIKVIPNTTG